jgi:hypothetical protein
MPAPGPHDWTIPILERCFEPCRLHDVLTATAYEQLVPFFRRPIPSRPKPLDSTELACPQSGGRPKVIGA